MKYGHSFTWEPGGQAVNRQLVFARCVDAVTKDSAAKTYHHSFLRSSLYAIETTNRQGKTMSNFIDFLERMGRDARLRHASQNEVEIALVGEQIDSELQAAILAKDLPQLGALLGQGVFCCMQEPGKEDEDEDDDVEESPSLQRRGSISHIGSRSMVSVA
jgi:hypothetical protein